MSPKTLFIAVLLGSLALSACVSKDQYVELQNEHYATQSQLEAEREQLADLQEKLSKLS